jgi:polysaccharide biosynthesis protein PslH
VTVLNCWSRRSAIKLAGVLRSGQYDSVQIEGTQLMAYLHVIQESRGQHPIVIDWHNVESELVSRYANTTRSWLKKIAAARTATLLERAEDKLLESSLTHTVASERERKKLLARCPNANIHIIPNGVDANYFSAKEIRKASRRAGQSDSKPTILFVGLMDFHANIDAVTWFSRNVWPEIARNHPEIQFQIVGRNPAPEVRALASDRIHVTGTVDDVRPYYASAVAAVVPLRSGSGTRLKILEAMAAEVPIVSTRLGAEGIDAEHNVQLLLADSGPEITAAIDRIVSSDETRKRLTAAARELIVARYDWSAIGERLYRIHFSLVQARQHSASRNGS